uniref:E3 ubiquitin-protein ligase TRIM7-like isoform X2 n=1 Tax=Myxine glutinosa TaxID=7769 RepID=UPI00358EBA24
MAVSSPIGDTMKDLTCAVCLQLFNEPIALPCGHSFCCCCIEKYWESCRGATGIACPNCRKAFPQKPQLNKNVTLASLVEQVKLSGSESTLGGEGHCEVCDIEAAMRCIPCDILCCEKHVKPHKEKGHKLVKPGEKVEKLRCSEHRNSMDFYCKDDERLMCSTCMVGHQYHQVVGVEVAHAEYKVSGRDDEEKLERKRKTMYRAVDEKVNRMKRWLNERLEVKLSQLEHRRENLQKKMDSLHEAESTLKASLEGLEATSFLQGYKDILHRLESRPHFTSKQSTQIDKQPRLLDFPVQEQNVKSLIQLNENLLKGIQQELVKELKTSELGTSILKRLYGQSPSLDRNSANPRIMISEDLRKATLSCTKHRYPEHPDRFDCWVQVLARESLSSGRHYWEVDVGSSSYCRIGIALNSIGRKGEECLLGENPKSWCVEKCFNEYTATHNYQRTILSVPGDLERFGFLLDCEAGELRCFGDSRFLHVFRGNFTVPVKPALRLGFGFGFGSGSVRFCLL